MSAADRNQGKGPRWKRIVAWVLVVLACILSVLSVVTVFARNQLLNTDAYVRTVAPLASNPGHPDPDSQTSQSEPDQPDQCRVPG